MAENTNENPTPGSEEYNAQMAQLADEHVNQPVGTGTEEPPTSDPQSDSKAEKPEAVPDKFWDAEKGEVNYKAWAESTTQLEQKLSGKSDEEGSDEATEGDESADDKPDVSQVSPEKFAEYSQEFAENGELSDDTYKALEDSGISRKYVDEYIAGQQAIAAQAENQLLNSAGFDSRDDFDKAASWAKANLTQSQLQEFNDAVTGDDAKATTHALEKLNEAYRSAKGSTSSSLLSGNGGNTGSDSFQSNQQMIDAISDPRYQKDPAYRAEVEAKIKRSKL